MKFQDFQFFKISCFLGVARCRFRRRNQKIWEMGCWGFAETLLCSWEFVQRSLFSAAFNVQDQPWNRRHVNIRYPWDIFSPDGREFCKVVDWITRRLRQGLSPLLIPSDSWWDLVQDRCLKDYGRIHYVQVLRGSCRWRWVTWGNLNLDLQIFENRLSILDEGLNDPRVDALRPISLIEKADALQRGTLRVLQYNIEIRILRHLLCYFRSHLHCAWRTPAHWRNWGSYWTTERYIELFMINCVLEKVYIYDCKNFLESKMEPWADTSVIIFVHFLTRIGTFPISWRTRRGVHNGYNWG